MSQPAQPLPGYKAVEDPRKNRCGRRIPFSCRLFFFGENEFEGEAHVLDLSANGCRASSLTTVEIGMVLHLSIFLPDHQWALRINEAIVRWIDKEEFGLEFVSITMAQRERLRSLVMNVR